MHSSARWCGGALPEPGCSGPEVSVVPPRGLDKQSMCSVAGFSGVSCPPNTSLPVNVPNSRKWSPNNVIGVKADFTFWSATEQFLYHTVIQKLNMLSMVQR
ncbi:hypothetical protein XENOCAPTIV_015179 [Xenoophorus captivus]|uniref:Uncharacterized protein n=1 Tax=Xenoophorus captivus TaxID=1517983 RepID=A0ABV0S260_9TELE